MYEIKHKKGRGAVLIWWWSKRESDCAGRVWLHCDQKATRHGLHAYQGAVYLEAVSDQDYCLRVLEKSQNCHQYFFNTFPSARKRSIDKEFYRLTKEQVSLA